ncbi:MAG: MFS transporter, partial [Rhodospirillales bacterium]|nr:MFS transporter [Rhodospirillales bacterium]
LADLFGRKPMMIVALLVFMASSVVCALSPNFWWLLAGRVLQGLGGGGLMTLAQALIGELVPPRERGSYQGYLSANIVAGTTIGPVAGGFVTQVWGWHSVFLCYLPLGLIAILLVLRLPPTAKRTGRASFDVSGMLLLTGFIVPLLVAVTQLQRLSVDMLPRLVLLLAIAAVVLAALVRQQRRAASPLLPLPLLREPSFWRADLMGACSGASLVAMITFLPIYFQVVTGASPAETGMLLIPLTGAVSFGAVVTGWLISRTGRTAIFPTFGLMVTGLSLIGLGSRCGARR